MLLERQRECQQIRVTILKNLVSLSQICQLLLRFFHSRTPLVQPVFPLSLSSPVMPQLHHLPDRTGYQLSCPCVVMVPGTSRMANSWSPLVPHAQDLLRRKTFLIYFSLQKFLVGISNHKKRRDNLSHLRPSTETQTLFLDNSYKICTNHYFFAVLGGVNFL